MKLRKSWAWSNGPALMERSVTSFGTHGILPLKCAEVCYTLMPASVESDMATAAELTPRVDKLEERVKNNVLFFRILAGAIVTALVWIGLSILHTSNQITGIQAELQIILPNYKLQAAARQPASQDTQKEAQRIIADAKSGRVPPLLPQSVEAAGNAFIAEAAKGDANAWDTVKALLDYRTSLNTIRIPGGLQQISGQVKTRYEFTAVPGKEPKLLVMMPVVDESEAARLEEIGTNLNEEVLAGPPVVVLQGGAIRLDGQYLKKVVLLGVEIHYKNKPVILENVAFINCTFVIDNGDNARELAKQLLASDTITFKTNV